jgi:hypothetical protein
LFALASLVVPVAVIQSAVVALGLPKIVAAAAPPLGFTARVLVTLALVGLGGLLGLVVGLRLGTRKAVLADEAPVTFGRRKSEAPNWPRWSRKTSRAGSRSSLWWQAILRIRMWHRWRRRFRSFPIWPVRLRSRLTRPSMPPSQHLPRRVCAPAMHTPMPRRAAR